MVPRKDELVEGVLVVGGGVAGLEVARNLSYAGLGVNIIEREDELGGVVRKLNQLYPEGMPNAHTLQPLIDEVKGLKNVRILTKAEMVSVEGEAGNYAVEIVQQGKRKKMKAGAIIIATGLKDYDIEKVTAYGYGRYDRVLKPLEFEEQVANGTIDPNELKRVVIINCAGSRDRKYLPYCSRVCCFIGLKEAKLIKDKNPLAEVYITYIDMRSYGNLESLYNTLRDDYHVNFLEGRPSMIEQVDGALYVKTEDKVLGDTVRIKADYVILSHGYIGDEKNLGMLNIPLDTGDKGMFPTTYINSSLSVDSNPKGVFICGCAAYPKNVAETLLGARSAALSAINTIRDISQKRPSAEINADICSEQHCKLCLYACSYGAIAEEEDGLRVISALCMGCGVCTATCPTGASSLEGVTDDDLMKEINEKVKQGDTVAFLCKWSAYPAYKDMGNNGLKQVKAFEVPCTGRVNAGLILRVLNKDAKNVLISGCYPDGCHYNKGNFIMRRRLSLTRNVLEQLGIPQEKVRIEWIGKKESKRVHTILKEMRGRG